MGLFSCVDLALSLGAHQVVDALTMLFQFLFQEIVFDFEIVFVFFEEWEPEKFYVTNRKYFDNSPFVKFDGLFLEFFTRQVINIELFSTISQNLLLLIFVLSSLKLRWYKIWVYKLNVYLALSVVLSLSCTTEIHRHGSQSILLFFFFFLLLAFFFLFLPDSFCLFFFLSLLFTDGSFGDLLFTNQFTLFNAVLK